MKDLFYKKLPLLWLIPLLLSLWLLYSTFAGYRSFRQHQNQLFIKRGAALAAFSAANICINIEGAARQLEILGKSEFFYDFKEQELLVPFLAETEEFFQQAAQAYLFEVGFAYERFLQLKRSFDYWKEVPDAFLRRIAFELGKLVGPESIDIKEDDDEFDGFVLPKPKFDMAESVEFYTQTRFARDMVTLFQIRVSMIFETLIAWAGKIDKLTRLGHSVLIDQTKAEKFLSIALNNRRWFSGLRVVNRFGYPLVNFSGTGIQPAF